MNLKTKLQDPYNFILATFIIYLAFAFFVDTPSAIARGLQNIVLTQDILMVDYMYVGGIGASLVNVVSVGILAICVAKLSKVEAKGIVIAGIWTMIGFAFFGKNVLNSLPIILGAYFYTLYAEEEFKKYVHISFFATALSPITTQMFFIGYTSIFVSFLFALAAGLMIGFFIIPLALFTARAHAGFNLYNVGFASGIIAIFSAAIIRNLGHPLSTLSKWSGGNNPVLIAFCFSICISLILFGLLNNKGYKNFSIKNYIENSKAMQDYFVSQDSMSYINMGLAGILSTALVLVFGGDLNGPLIGGVLTLIGFAAVGKHPLNMVPIMVGCMLAVLLYGFSPSEPGFLLTALFGTTLAPIPAKFGFFWGVVAGMLHLTLAIQFSEFHGGLNLYNNGAAGGFVAILLVPIIHAIQKKEVS